MSERVQWKSNYTFLMAMIGSAVGLGNIWRFPYLFYSNGQGAFLIPYLIAILIMGLPFILLEYAIGVHFKDSVLGIVDKVNPKFKALGWAIILIPFLIMTYYVLIVGWDFNYFFLSWTKAWGANPNLYFNTEFLHLNSLSFEITILSYVLIAVVVLWFITWLISSRGLNEGIGSFTSIFVPILFFLGIGIAVYNLLLPGSYIGLIKFFSPDWSLLTHVDIWLSAFGQILFTLSLGVGVIMTYSSHLSDGTNLGKNALIVILANCGFELFNAIGVFSILGYMSYTTGVAFDSLITEGTGLAFVAYPAVFNTMGIVGNILGSLFFVCILIAGITTVISFIEPLSDSLQVRFNLSRRKTVTIVCILGCLITAAFSTNLGAWFVTVSDTFLNNFGVVCLVILQCIFFSYMLNLDKISEKLDFGIFNRFKKAWKIILKYVLPILLFIIWIFGIYTALMKANYYTLIAYGVLSVILIVVPLLLAHYDKSTV